MRDNDRITKSVLWVLFLGWMILIFYMSHQPAVISDQQSGLVIKIINKLGIELQGVAKETVVFIVRKIAHYSEYFILAILAYNLLRCYKDKRRSVILSIFIIFLYACTDEIHQLFVIGRNGCMRDVFIDTFGGSTYLVLVSIYNYVKKRK